MFSHRRHGAAVGGTIFLFAGAAGLSLPSFQLNNTGSAVNQRSGLEASDKWWVQVDDQVYHAPESSSLLSPHIDNYYYAIGSDAGLSEELRQNRVGGSGRWHIFHMPEGISLLETKARSGDRRSSMSALSKLASGLTLTKGFPSYDRNDEYRNPLSKAGQKQEKKAVAMVTRENYKDYLESLVALPTRSWNDPEASHAAVSLLKKEFAEMGYKVCQHKFESQGQNLVNLLAYKAAKGSQAVIVGAHYDSRPFTGAAPGAVDNGSGVAGLLAMAKALHESKVKTEMPVIFAAFAGEEAGLLGSKQFADDLKNGAEAIPRDCVPVASNSFLDSGPHSRTTMMTGAIIMDEVGWKAHTGMYDGAATVNLESQDWTQDVMQHLVASNKEHNGDKLNVVHSNKPFGSDHCSFLDLGLKSVLTIQGDDESYPDYHKASDKIDNVDFDYATHIVRMNMGAMLRMAGVRGGNKQHLTD
jgi:hypothetical protein